MTTLTKWSFAGQPLYVFSPSPAEPPHNPRHLQISVITSAVHLDMAAATALLKIADCTMLFEPNPTTLLSFGGSIPVTAIQINMLAVSAKDLQCGRDPRMVTLIFADTEWSLSTGRQLLFPESPPFPLRSTAISMRMPSMAFAVDHVLRMATTLSQHATPTEESVCRDAQPAAINGLPAQSCSHGGRRSQTGPPESGQ